MSAAVTELAGALRGNRDGFLLVVTGAGVSRASGVPTFRGAEAEAVWRQDDVELATRACFARDPVAQWRWYLRRFESLASARPNPAHHALAALERWQLGAAGGFLLVSQNIDTLHEEAGSQLLVKVHGSADRLRCSRMGCHHGAPGGSLPRAAVELAAFRDDPRPETLPRCPSCGSLLRAHALFFDEYYDEHDDYQLERVLAAAEAADLTLFVGTSLAVGITALIVRAALARQAPILVVDPAHRPLVAALPARFVRGEAEILLPAVCRELGIR